MLALFVTAALAAEPSPDLGRFAQRHQRAQLVGMSVLGGYAVANIAWGVSGALRRDGVAQHVSEMNAAWNGVNLTLAVAGVVRNRRPPPLSDWGEAMTLQRRTQRIYAINAGLDVLYVGAASAMWGLSGVRDGPQRDRLEGYGRSIALQGAFLFAFDLSMLLAHERVRNGAARRLTLSPRIEPTSTGIGLAGRF